MWIYRDPQTTGLDAGSEQNTEMSQHGSLVELETGARIQIFSSLDKCRISAKYPLNNDTEAVVLTQVATYPTMEYASTVKKTLSSNPRGVTA